MKSALFKALSYYRIGMSHGESDEYGTQVGRYMQANKYLDEAKKKHLKYVSNEFQTNVNALHTVNNTSYIYNDLKIEHYECIDKS